MQPDIPEDQIQRIAPIVDELRSTLANLTAALPFLAESALMFTPEAEAE